MVTEGLDAGVKAFRAVSTAFKIAGGTAPLSSSIMLVSHEPQRVSLKAANSLVTRLMLDVSLRYSQLLGFLQMVSSLLST